MPDDVELLTPEDLNEIREVGSKIIRNLSLFMDNPFSYAHLVEICENDLKTLATIRERCGLKGDGLLPAHPIGQQSVAPDIPTLLVDAGFSRLREVVDDLMKPKGGDLE
tara:strand:+ start:527 stop:853 length:327 start_codon:yes stop_codon:yes gene_type:complete